MTTTRELLKEAYRLIRRDQPELARDILRPILEDEPDNAHAWWLLAYSVDDPHEVRDALTKVLEIDPNYTNADKAREMLAALEDQYFSGSAPESDSLFGDEFGAAETGDVLGDTFGTDDSYESYDATFFEDDDSLLSDFGDEPLGVSDDAGEVAELRATLGTDETLSDDSLDDLFGTDGVVTDETVQAAAEEKAGSKGGGSRLLRLVVFLLLLAVVVIGVWFVFLREDKAAEDPGALAAVETNADTDAAITNAQARLVAAGLGAEQQALVSSTSLGNTLFLSFCREPSRTLPQDVVAAMEIAVEEAANMPADIAAVGVSINRCNVDPHDTLYRAFVSVENTRRYAAGEFGADADGWAAFQATWQKP